MKSQRPSTTLRRGRITIVLHRTTFTIRASYTLEDDDETSNIGTWWSVLPPPVFRVQEIDDLIAALQEVKRRREVS